MFSVSLWFIRYVRCDRSGKKNSPSFLDDAPDAISVRQLLTAARPVLSTDLCK